MNRYKLTLTLPDGKELESSFELDQFTASREMIGPKAIILDRLVRVCHGFVNELPNIQEGEG